MGEGILGSQVREKTDALGHAHADQPRAEWIEELEQSWVYLVHRSFSWALVALAAVFFFKTRQASVGGSVGRAPTIIFAIMLSQMVLGLLLAFAGVPPVVQVLHVGLSSILVATEFYFLLATRVPRGGPKLA